MFRMNKSKDMADELLSMTVGWGYGNWEMHANEYISDLFGVIKMFKIDYDDGCSTANMLKTIEFYAVKGQILWYVIYISMKLLKRPLRFLVPHHSNQTQTNQNILLTKT